MYKTNKETFTMETKKIKAVYSYEGELEMLLHILESNLNNKYFWAANLSFRILLELLHESLNTEITMQSFQVDAERGYLVLHNDWYEWTLQNEEGYNYISTLKFEKPDYNQIPNDIIKLVDAGEYCKIEATNKDMILCFKNAFAKTTDSHFWISRREDCRTPDFSVEELEAIELIAYIYDRHSKMLSIDINDSDISFALETMSSVYRKLIYATNTIAYKLDTRQRDYLEVIIGEVERNAF